MTAVDLLKLIGAEIGREERLPPEYGVLEYARSMRGSWYVRFEGQFYGWARSPDAVAAYAVKAIGWDVIAHRLAARVTHLRGVLDDLEVQVAPGIADGWVCVPAVEWEQAMKRAVEMPGADPSRYERSAP
ncbi:MAG TPA: hypothetical protein VFH17_00405 [Coriobacteriia bacterium]|nr:hypothetical protein [Coriobacteriia bacterium]